jgi:hypothetical protein
VIADLVRCVACSFCLHKRMVPRSFCNVKLTGRAENVPGYAWPPIPLPNALGSTPEENLWGFSFSIQILGT